MFSLNQSNGFNGSRIGGKSAMTCSILMLEPSETARGVKTGGYASIMALSVLGNLLVIATVFRNSRMRTGTNFIIVNMATSDLLIATFGISRQISEIYLGGLRWTLTGQLGNAACKLVYFLQDLGMGVSIYSLLLLAIDRFYAVVYPLKAVSFSNKLPRVLSLVWAAGASIAATHLYTFRLLEFGDKTYCYLNWAPAFNHKRAMQVQILTGFVLLYAVPWVTIVVLYIQIVRKLRSPIISNSNFTHSQSLRREREKRNVFRMSVVIIIIFLLSWAPFLVFMFIRFYDLVPYDCDTEVARFTVLFIGYSNGSISPFLYFIFSENYRKGVTRMFACA